MQNTLEEHIKAILSLLGEDIDRQGLKKTPQRVANSLRYLTGGKTQSLAQLLNDALFDSTMEEMVLVKDIELYSLCEHHLLPFFGKCHVAYIPNGKLIGLSKIPRVIDFYARRLQVQEQLTEQIAECLIQVLQAKGVAVMIEAKHLCMLMRGVEKQHACMKTSVMKGLFNKNMGYRTEFLSAIG